MNTSPHLPCSLVIYGNHWESWLCAAIMGRLLANSIAAQSIDITLVSDPSLNNQDLCLHCEPSDAHIFQMLGIDEQVLVSDYDASFNVAYSFQSKEKPKRYYPFGDVGLPLKGIGFQHIWRKLQDMGLPCDFTDFSLAAACAKGNKFCHPSSDKRSVLSSLDYGLNIRSSSLTQVLTRMVKQQGIRVINKRLASVNRQQSSSIQVTLEDGAVLAADMFIDTSQEAALISEPSNYQALGVPFLVTHLHTPTYPIELSSATHCKQVGASWQIKSDLPNGSFYRCISPINSIAQKQDHQNAHLQSIAPLHSGASSVTVQHLSCNQAAIKRPWVGNVLALGSANQQLLPPPLSPIKNLYQQLSLFLQLMPTSTDDLDISANEFNRLAGIRQSKIAELTTVLFRKMEPGFQDMTLTAPAVSHLLNVFTEHGKITWQPESPLPESSWVKLLFALGYSPSSGDPLLKKHDMTKVSQQLKQGLKLIQDTCQRIPSALQYRQHFVDQYTRTTRS